MPERARHLVFALLVAALSAPHPVSGQAGPAGSAAADAWRAPYAAGEQARASGDVPAYAREMAAAAEALPAGHLNRPFVQYHAARAAALAGRSDEAVSWLRRAWEEDIEALMISFAPYDPAFASMLEHAGFRAVMGLAADMELGVRPLAGSTHLITGAGSNVVAQVGDDGVLIVDTGYEPALPALRRALGTLGAERVERLVITHPHEDHMAAAAELGAEGTVLAHPGTAAAMREPYVFMEGVELPPKPETALPDVEIARDTTFRFNGEEVRVVSTAAHTASDLTVYFAGSRVAHFGDTYLGGNPMMFPGQADPDGFLDALDALLDSMHPETIVVSGHDAPTDLAAVRAQIEASRACMALVREALAEGLTVEATAERAAGRFAPQWVAFFYRLFSTR